MPFFDDIKVGDRMELGSYTFTPELVVAFASKFDPQPFPSRRGGRPQAPLFGGLAASGWHTAAAWMKLMVASRLKENAESVSRAASRWSWSARRRASATSNGSSRSWPAIP